MIEIENELTFFSATFSATYIYYEKSERYLNKKDNKQNFGTWIWGSSPYETAKKQL